LPGDPVGVSLEPRRYAGIGIVLLGRGVPLLEVTDLVPTSRAIMRADFRGDAVTFLGRWLSAERNVNIIVFFLGSVAVDTLSGPVDFPAPGAWAALGVAVPEGLRPRLGVRRKYGLPTASGGNTLTP
jgi:hypothetical protein